MRPDPTHAEISARAHAIWLARGGTPGRSLDDWLQAERELRGGAAPRVGATVPAPASRPTPSSSFAPPPAPVSPHGAPPPRPPAAPVSSFAPPLAPAKPSSKPLPAPTRGGGGSGGKTKKNKKRK
jgi:hypothetical protein